jgi:hypothetical protein
LTNPLDTTPGLPMPRLVLWASDPNNFPFALAFVRALHARRPRRPRKPRIATLIKHAEKVGKTVTSITTPDGTTINFDESTKSESENALNQWIAKHARASERH